MCKLGQQSGRSQDHLPTSSSSSSPSSPKATTASSTITPSSSKTTSSEPATTVTKTSASSSLHRSLISFATAVKDPSSLDCQIKDSSYVKNLLTLSLSEQTVWPGQAQAVHCRCANMALEA